MSAPVSAVVNGHPDDEAIYPYVGTLIISVPTVGVTEYHYWCSAPARSAGLARRRSPPGLVTRWTADRL
jgi:hypothetical protein